MSTRTSKVKTIEDELADFEADESLTSFISEEKKYSSSALSSLTTTTFSDFLLKPEILSAIAECGFEHPSDVQLGALPSAILGTDIICQAKSGMGKTAIFVIAILQKIEIDSHIDTIILAPTRELAYQISNEFQRLGKFLPNIKISLEVIVTGGTPADSTLIKEAPSSHIVIGTPGRLRQLVNSIDLSHVKHFVIDECDRVINSLPMRKNVQKIFLKTPIEKQVMMFSATIGKDTRTICSKFASKPLEIFIDEESKLTLHGLLQYYYKLTEKEKIAKLESLLDTLEFSQVVIFVKNIRRATVLNNILTKMSFPSITIHSGVKLEERFQRYNDFRNNKYRILVVTDLFTRGIDLQKVNIIINFDMPETFSITPKGRGLSTKGTPPATIIKEDASDTYLHRVGRAGRFGTKGLAISFIADDKDAKVLESVQSRFEVEITSLPEKIDSTLYMTA